MLAIKTNLEVLYSPSDNLSGVVYREIEHWIAFPKKKEYTIQVNEWVEINGDVKGFKTAPKKYTYEQIQVIADNSKIDLSENDGEVENIAEMMLDGLLLETQMSSRYGTQNWIKLTE